MAIESRINNVIVNQNGSVQFELAEGDWPLPPAPEGGTNNPLFASKAAFIAAAREAQAAIAPYLWFIKAAEALQADATFGAAFVTAAKTGSVILNLDGINGAIIT